MSKPPVLRQPVPQPPPQPPQPPQPQLPLRKTRRCRFHETPKGCGRGDACNYAHSDAELQQPSNAQLSQALEAERTQRRQHEAEKKKLAAENRQLKLEVKAKTDGPEWQQTPSFWCRVPGGPFLVRGQYKEGGYNVQKIEQHLNAGLGNQDDGCSCADIFRGFVLKASAALYRPLSAGTGQRCGLALWLL